VWTSNSDEGRINRRQEIYNVNIPAVSKIFTLGLDILINLQYINIIFLYINNLIEGFF